MSSLLSRLEGNSRPKNWIKAHLDYPHKDWCLIWPFSVSDTGYAILDNPGNKVSRIICEYRHGPAPTPQHHSAHSCDRGHDACVNPWHLDWKTPTENQLDRRRNGFQPRAKLTIEQAREIRDLKGLEHTKDTAARYGIRESNVRHIQSGKTWRKDKPDGYTPEEDAKIIEAIARGYSFREMAAFVGRPRSGVQRRTYRLGLRSGRPPDPPKNKRSEA